MDQAHALDWDQLAHDLVAELAPDELPLIDAAPGAFRVGNQRAVPRGRRQRDRALGYGIDGTVALMTPVILLVITKVIDHLADQLGERVADRVGGAVRTRIRRVFRRGKPAAAPLPPVPAALTAAQLGEVRTVAHDTARQAGLPEAKADLLADALVGRLASRD